MGGKGGEVSIPTIPYPEYKDPSSGIQPMLDDLSKQILSLEEQVAAGPEIPELELPEEVESVDWESVQAELAEAEKEKALLEAERKLSQSKTVLTDDEDEEEPSILA